jgi:hydroxymethylglutaryl-CoA lyase
MTSAIKITECPRDAMQGLHTFVPTELKATYINLLLGVGFDTIDFGSFVSPKAIPQMRDTADVLQKLELDNTRSKLLAIIANYRGAEDASSHEQITYLGFPFSISETFQRRNTNSGITESFETVKKIQGLCISKKKKLRIYLSMGFGNPYGDAWSVNILNKWADEMAGLGIEDIYLADTIGVATPAQITQILKDLTGPGKVNLGMHLHSTPDTWQEKIEAAYMGGCRLFDSALKGYGGCPMAKDELTGNIATENLIGYLSAQNENLGLNLDKLREAMDFSVSIFG